MRSVRAGVSALAVSSVLITAIGPGTTTATTPSSPESTLRDYCVTCHSQRLRTGGLSIEGLDPANVAHDAETWEKVVRKLRLGTMPPLGARRPDRAAYDNAIDWLEEKLDAAGAAHPNPGRPVLHRLNRAEYANAIRDLLGLDVDVSLLLPPDDAAYGFDNVADALGSSPALLQAYLAAARKISAVAVGDPRVGAGSDTYSVRQDLSQDQHLEGLPLGTFGGMTARHTFPVDGEYDFQVRLFRTNLNAIRGVHERHQVELMLDGGRILAARFGGADDLVPLQENPTATSDAIEAQRLRVRVFVKAGERQISAAFPEEAPALLATTRLKPFLRDFDNPYAADGPPHVQSITIQGPYDAKAPVSAPGSRAFVCRPAPNATPAAEAACAARIVSALARRAYRRPVPGTEIAQLMSFYQQERARGSFDTGVEFALRRILASPSFVFRPEREPPGLVPGTPYRVTDVELASRLSFFLWSSIPDEKLLRAAEQGALTRPEVLATETRRMLSGPKSDALISNFAGQWLQLRNLKGIVPDSDTFPDFDDNLRQAFRREAELFFASIVREDRNVLDLMTADYTFVNERLAKHYHLPNVFGSDFRRVTLADETRRGLLGKGAVLLVTSHATTTSPVLRGKWVLENLLGSPPPPPPPDVPALREDEPGGPRRTMREQMEQHRNSPACAACHKAMDPFGFALENFDVVGAWRTANQTGAVIDAADVLPNGARVDGVAGLRKALLERPDVFVRTLTEKLFVYALGRGVTYQDMPAVRKIVRDARAQDYRFSALISGIVGSVPFQMAVVSGGEN
jgi:mono/diheme cytochrome c family protein